MDRLAQLVKLVMPDLRVRLDQWVRLEHPEPQEERDIPERLAHQVSRDKLGSRARQDFRGIREQLETLEHPGHWDQLEVLDPRVRRDLLGHRVRRVTLETLDPLEAKVLLDPKDFRESMVQQV